MIERSDLMNLFIWYPKCSTCQKARQALEEKGLSLELRDIKQDNPTKEELKTWIKKSNLPIKSYFNTNGLLYRNQNLKEKIPHMSEEEQIDLLSTDGMLVKRPILITDDKIIVGYKKKEYESL